MQPVTIKETVQVFQIVERRIGGGQHIAPSVIPVVVAQTEVLAGGGHKLPQTDGIAAGSGMRIKHALDHRDSNKLHWQLTPFNLLYHQIEVGFSPAGNGRQMLIIAQQPLTLLADARIVRSFQLHIIADTHPQIVRIFHFVQLFIAKQKS